MAESGPQPSRKLGMPTQLRACGTLAREISYEEAIEQLEREILKILRHWYTSGGNSG
jgi:hypothetical protein